MAKTFRKALVAALVLTAVTTATAQASPVAHREVVAGGETYRLTLAAPTTISADRPVPIFGHGYNEAQGIFVALCVIPDGVDPRDPSTFTKLPTPCLGPRGAGGVSHRIVNGATGEHTSPYGPNGSFHVRLNLRPKIDDAHECGVNAKCAIVTRADFTATANRNYDLYVPVRFS